MSKTIVLLSGPPNSGKGFLAEHLIKKLGGVEKEFKASLYRQSAKIFGMDLERFKSLATHRILKEKPHQDLSLLYGACIKLDKLRGKDHAQRVVDVSEGVTRYRLSPRDAMIYTSELVYKLIYGPDYFGLQAANTMEDGNNFVSDAGFAEEAEVQVMEFGKENVLLVRIHRDDTTFEGDSRDYLDLDYLGVSTLDVDNNRDISEVVSDIAEFMANELW
tara:strand:+ start:271 stop:924 length:654 start_codon:yes stop_codon:yes gene_type:complete